MLQANSQRCNDRRTPPPEEGLLSGSMTAMGMLFSLQGPDSGTGDDARLDGVELSRGQTALSCFLILFLQTETSEALLPEERALGLPPQSAPKTGPPGSHSGHHSLDVSDVQPLSPDNEHHGSESEW